MSGDPPAGYDHTTWARAVTALADAINWQQDSGEEDGLRAALEVLASGPASREYRRRNHAFPAEWVRLPSHHGAEEKRVILRGPWTPVDEGTCP